MNNLKKSLPNTRTYIPPRIVLSSQISRQDLNTKETDTVETDTVKTEKRDDVDDLFQKLSEQMHEKIKQCRENKDKLKFSKPFGRKGKNNFVDEFLDVKKRFEADLAANSRIYQNSSMNLANSETLRDINNEEYNLRISSADEYMRVLQSQKTAQSDSLNKAVNKYYSVQSRNWVPGAAVTKLKLIDSETNSGDSAGEIKNQKPSQHSDLNDQGRKIRDKVNNRQLYSIVYKFDQAPTKAKSKKKSFIEEFNEFKNKLGITSRNKTMSHEENSEIINAEIKDRKASNPDLKQNEKSEKINKKIVTPFPGIKTSFFSNNNNFDESANSNRKKRSKAKADITANWVKGDQLQRKASIFNYIDSKNREQTPERMYESEDLSIEEKQEFNFTPINKYSRISPSYTPDVHTSAYTSNDAYTCVDFTPENRKREQSFKNLCTSLAMSTVQYSKNINIQHGINKSNCVITETKITNFIFPADQMNIFQRR